MLVHINEAKKALKYYKKLKNHYKRYCKPKNILLLDAYISIGNTYKLLNNMPEAIKYYEKSEELLEIYHPHNSEFLLKVYNNLFGIYLYTNQTKKANENSKKYEIIKEKCKNQTLSSDYHNFKNNRYIASLNIFEEIIQNLSNQIQVIIQNLFNFSSSVPEINYDGLGMFYDLFESYKKSFGSGFNIHFIRKCVYRNG